MSTRREVESFDLRIWRGPGDEYVANVREAGGRVAEARFSNPFEETALREELAGAVRQDREAKRDLSGVLKRDPERDFNPASPKARTLAEKLGRRLFQAVFTGEVLWAWLRRLDGVGKEGEELRLRLILNDPEVWNWPWELLHDGNPVRGFLSVVPGMQVVRYIEPRVEVRPLGVRPPLHILAVGASPRGVAQLSVKQELDELEASLEPLRQAGWVRLERLEEATLDALLRKLKEESFHVLHFVGHCAFDEKHGGRVLLESTDGSPDPVRNPDLALLLKVSRRLRLIVLNSCEGARGDRSDDFAGLAQNLVRSGFPAVIGMRSVISDQAAVHFSRFFYEALARRQPVDRALSEARQAMYFKDSRMEWGSPVLAMSCADGVLFDLTLGERAIARLRRWIEKWKHALLLVLLLFLVLAAFRSARRWIDPNFLWAALNPPECPSPPGMRIAFVLVEPGRLTTGGVKGDSRVRREVEIEQPYCIARFETTQGLWGKVRKEKRSRRKGAGLPVASVSVEDVRGFFNVLNSREPEPRFRFPSNNEWEYAARAGGRAWVEAPPGSANCRDKERNDGFEGTAPVGLFPRNAWGLSDMFGNVAEWAADETTYTYLRRGGSYENALENCDSIFESRVDPKTRAASTGFRIVRDLL